MIELFLNLMIWTSCIIFLFPLTHRSNYLLRVISAFIIAVIFCVLSHNLHFWNNTLQLVLNYILVVFFILFCGIGALTSALYCGVWVLLIQQLTTEIWLLICRLLTAIDLTAIGLAFVIFAAVYTIVGMTIVRWMPEKGCYRAGPRQLSSALVLLIIFEVLYQYITFELRFNELNLYVLLLLTIQVYCATMLYLQQTLFKKSAMKQELALLNRLWYEQRDQYAIARENIELINRKCHDLKHQMAAMRLIPNSEEREQYLQEIENSIHIYDAIAHTGNEVLDTILTEKSLTCDAKNITVNYIADGAALSFMDPVDLYTILGNAMDNAMESVQQLPDSKKRLIDLLICTEQNFLLIEIINPLNQQLTFQDGLPVSIKSKDGYHGFGLKSIRHTVEKYDGHLSVSVENGCFSLKILIPNP